MPAPMPPRMAASGWSPSMPEMVISWFIMVALMPASRRFWGPKQRWRMASQPFQGYG